MRIDPQTLASILSRYSREGRPVHRVTDQEGECDAIDLYFDIGGGYMLRTDGTVLEWEVHPDLSSPLLIADDGSALRGLVIAGRRNVPELKSALPTRPVTATMCEACGGHGFVDFGDHPKLIICYECDGLGWQSIG